MESKVKMNIKNNKVKQTVYTVYLAVKYFKGEVATIEIDVEAERDAVTNIIVKKACDEAFKRATQRNLAIKEIRVINIYEDITYIVEGDD